MLTTHFHGNLRVQTRMLIDRQGSDLSDFPQAELQQVCKRRGHKCLKV